MLLSFYTTLSRCLEVTKTLTLLIWFYLVKENHNFLDPKNNKWREVKSMLVVSIMMNSLGFPVEYLQDNLL